MRHILLIIAFFISSTCFAQKKQMKSLAEAEKLSESVSADFAEYRIAEAFEKLSQYWPIPQNEVDGLEEKTIKYHNILKERFGKPIGFSKVRTEKIGDFAVRETYLVRYEVTGVRLIFTYYKNNTGWIVNAFKWDDSFDEEFRME